MDLKLLKAEVQKIVFDPTSKFEPDPLPYIRTYSFVFYLRSENKVQTKH